MDRPSIPRWLAESPAFERALREAWKPSPSCGPFVNLVNYKKALFTAARFARKERIEDNSAPLLFSVHGPWVSPV